MERVFVLGGAEQVRMLAGVGRRFVEGVVGAAGLAGFAWGCAPVTTAEAESKDNVEWLDQSGTPDALAALGRVADRDPRAIAVLERRADAASYAAAWSAVDRGAPWGATMLRSGLSDARHADIAASAMARHDAHLANFVDDVELAVERSSNSVASYRDAPAIVLASIGPPARAAIDRRLLDPSTRNSMCVGIASSDADPTAMNALFETSEAGRDATACLGAVVAGAAKDDSKLPWLGERGETGLLGAAGRDRALPCPRLATVWSTAFAARPREAYAALTVPLGQALARCPAELDGVVADALRRLPAAHVLIVEAIDPWSDYRGGLRATCAALPGLALPKDAAVREHVDDALAHACSQRVP